MIGGIKKGFETFVSHTNVLQGFHLCNKMRIYMCLLWFWCYTQIFNVSNSITVSVSFKLDKNSTKAACLLLYSSVICNQFSCSLEELIILQVFHNLTAHSLIYTSKTELLLKYADFLLFTY